MALARVLGRISKKLPKLELLPILENAPNETKEYIAEATRCYLLKMERACVALCRACVEHTLKGTLTDSMKQELVTEMETNKRRFRDPQPMKALIEVCARHGRLGSFVKEAHEVREHGNRILHLQNTDDKKGSDTAWGVLEKTRKIVGLVYGRCPRDEGA